MTTVTEGRTAAHRVGHLSIKLIAAVVILVCLAVGIAGLILPLIPGLLFLVVAAFIASRHFPAAERWARKSPTLDGYMDDASRLSRATLARLTPGERLRVGALFFAKTLVAGVALVGGAAVQLVRGAAKVVATVYRRRY